MKYRTLIVLLVIVFPLYGQRCEKSNFLSRNEFSIVLDDLFAKNALVYYPYISPLSSYYVYPDYPFVELNTPKMGLGYKYHFAGSALRSKLSFGFRDYKSDDLDDTSKTENSLLTTGFHLGYELHKNINNIQIFYGADLFANYSKFNSKTTNVNNSQTYIYDRIYSYSGFGISPLLGVKYFISSSFSLSTELKFTIESFRGEDIYKNSSYAEENKTEISGIDTKFGPFGQLSINIHF
jgi:hypothetical protein